jgi:hypothetical protein
MNESCPDFRLTTLDSLLCMEGVVIVVLFFVIKSLSYCLHTLSKLHFT